MQDASDKTILDLKDMGRILCHVRGVIQVENAAACAWHNYVVPCTTEETHGAYTVRKTYRMPEIMFLNP